MHEAIFTSAPHKHKKAGTHEGSWTLTGVTRGLNILQRCCWAGDVNRWSGCVEKDTLCNQHSSNALG